MNKEFTNLCKAMLHLNGIVFPITLYFCFMTEYKKAKQELKKATAETNKWQKKVKKGELGEQSFF